MVVRRGYVLLWHAGERAVPGPVAWSLRGGERKSLACKVVPLSPPAEELAGVVTLLTLIVCITVLLSLRCMGQVCWPARLRLFLKTPPAR